MFPLLSFEMPGSVCLRRKTFPLSGGKGFRAAKSAGALVTALNWQQGRFISPLAK
jgi:hypothetical protein